MMIKCPECNKPLTGRSGVLTCKTCQYSMSIDVLNTVLGDILVDRAHDLRSALKALDAESFPKGCPLMRLKVSMLCRFCDKATLVAFTQYTNIIAAEQLAKACISINRLKCGNDHLEKSLRARALPSQELGW